MPYNVPQTGLSILRHATGLKTIHVRELTGLTFDAYRRLETGKTVRAEPEHVAALATLLDAPVEALAYRRHNEEAEKTD